MTAPLVRGSAPEGTIESYFKTKTQFSCVKLILRKRKCSILLTNWDNNACFSCERECSSNFLLKSWQCPQCHYQLWSKMKTKTFNLTTNLDVSIMVPQIIFGHFQRKLNQNSKSINYIELQQYLAWRSVLFKNWRHSMHSTKTGSVGFLNCRMPKRIKCQ